MLAAIFSAKPFLVFRPVPTAVPPVEKNYTSIKAWLCQSVTSQQIHLNFIIYTKSGSTGRVVEVAQVDSAFPICNIMNSPGNYTYFKVCIKELKIQNTTKTMWEYHDRLCFFQILTMTYSHLSPQGLVTSPHCFAQFLLFFNFVHSITQLAFVPKASNWVT